MFLVQTLCHLAPSEKGALGVSISHFLENGTGGFSNLISGYLGLDRFVYPEPRLGRISSEPPLDIPRGGEPVEPQSNSELAVERA